MHNLGRATPNARTTPCGPGRPPIARPRKMAIVQVHPTTPNDQMKKGIFKKRGGRQEKLGHSEN